MTDDNDAHAPAQEASVEGTPMPEATPPELSPVAAAPAETQVDPNAPKNPYVGRGLFFSAKEEEIVSMGIMAVMEQAQRDGKPELRRPCTALLVRIQQLSHAGEGMTPRTAQAIGARISAAMESAARGEPGASAAIEQGVSDLLASSLRLDPDPAEKIGNMLAALVNQSATQAARSVALVSLQGLGSILADAKGEWDRGGWPSPSEVMTWVMQLVELGVSNVHDGLDPWAVAEAPEQTPAEPAAEPVSQN